MGNSIYNNGELGINLNDDGENANDPDDADTGTNNLQNFPVLTSAVVGNTTTTIQGTLNSEAGTSYRVEFFSNPINEREGKIFLGFQNVTTDAGGDATINATVSTLAFFG